jgi:hypothetical protein
MPEASPSTAKQHQHLFAAALTLSSVAPTSADEGAHERDRIVGHLELDHCVLVGLLEEL